jgi:hypothetical protein
MTGVIQRRESSIHPNNAAKANAQAAVNAQVIV